MLLMSSQKSDASILIFIYFQVFEYVKLGFLFCLWFQQPQIILLKEGTDSSQGVPQIISNINACQCVADAVRTTLGPRGMDKLIINDQGQYEVFY